MPFIPDILLFLSIKEVSVTFSNSASLSAIPPSTPMKFVVKSTSNINILENAKKVK